MATSYTVLVVEQTDVVRQITKRILSERGYRVLGAANTTEALAVLAMPETHIDLVLIGAVGSVERGQLRWDWSELPASAAEGNDALDFGRLV